MSPLFLVVEDHPEIAENNCKFLQQIEPTAVCVIATNPNEALERLKLETPQLIVLDLQFWSANGSQSATSSLSLLEHIFTYYPCLNILIYSSEPNLINPLIKSIDNHQGGFVVVNKMERRKAFLEGVSAALNGELKLPKHLRKQLKLNEKELEILQLICREALTDKAIATRLNLSLRAVQNQIQHLKAKLGIDELERENKDINTRIALCTIALSQNLLSR